MEIEVEELHAGRTDGRKIAVVDVREPWEVAICALPDSRNVPMAALPQSLNDLPHDGVLAVVCHHGARSLQAAAWLRRQGFDNAVSLRGGIDAWARRIDPTMATY